MFHFFLIESAIQYFSKQYTNDLNNVLLITEFVIDVLSVKCTFKQNSSYYCFRIVYKTLHKIIYPRYSRYFILIILKFMNKNNILLLYLYNNDEIKIIYFSLGYLTNWNILIVSFYMVNYNYFAYRKTEK